jgi:hypothetical protein
VQVLLRHVSADLLDEFIDLFLAFQPHVSHDLSEFVWRYDTVAVFIKAFELLPQRPNLAFLEGVKEDLECLTFELRGVGVHVE